MRRVTSFLEKISLGILVLFLATMMVMVFLSIVGRLMPVIARTWYQEISNGCFIWVGFLGTSVGVKQGGHFIVDIISKKFSGKKEQGLKIFVHVIVLIAALIMLIYGIPFAKLGSMTISPLTQLPLLWSYIAVPISSGLSMFYALEKILETVKTEM
jgi:TRAP-type C4-dicarboxylate transport system permease small subunit